MGIDQLRQTPTHEAIFARLKQDGKPVGPNELVMKTIRERMQLGLPLQLVGFWGIGKKDAPDKIDKDFITELGELQNELESIYSGGAQITVILADMHGIFNGEVLEDGIRANDIRKRRKAIGNAHAPYLAKVEQVLHEREIHTVWLSDLYAQYGLEIPNIQEAIDTNSEAWTILQEEDQGRRDSYLHSARHNNRGVSAIQAAYHYIRERLQEKRMLHDLFPNHIFFVNGGRNLAIRIVPEGDMPILYLRRGPVWFLQGDQKGGENL